MRVLIFIAILLTVTTSSVLLAQATTNDDFYFGENLEQFIGDFKGIDPEYDIEYTDYRDGLTTTSPDFNKAITNDIPSLVENDFENTDIEQFGDFEGIDPEYNIQYTDDHDASTTTSPDLNTATTNDDFYFGENLEQFIGDFKGIDPEYDIEYTDYHDSLTTTSPDFNKVPAVQDTPTPIVLDTDHGSQGEYNSAMKTGLPKVYNEFSPNVGSSIEPPNHVQETGRYNTYDGIKAPSDPDNSASQGLSADHSGFGYNTVDGGSNTVDGGSNTDDGGSNTGDGGFNTTDGSQGLSADHDGFGNNTVDGDADADEELFKKLMKKWRSALPKVKNQFGSNVGTSHEPPTHVQDTRLYDTYDGHVKPQASTQFTASRDPDDPVSQDHSGFDYNTDGHGGIDGDEQLYSEKTENERKSDLPKVYNHFGSNVGTSNEPPNHVQDIGLYKTYDDDVKRQASRLIGNEDTTIDEHRFRLPPTARLRLRRKRRNTRNTYSNGDGRRRFSAQSDSDCDETAFWKSASFYVALCGWVIVAIVSGLFVNLKYKVCHRYKEYRQECNEEQDLEAQPEEGDLTIYHREGRRPTGFGFVRLHKDSIEIIDESYELKGLPETPAPLEIKQKITAPSNRDIQHSKNLAERRRIIKKVTFDSETQSLDNGIKYAQSVIVGASEREKVRRKSAEKRAVIKGHYVGVRRPSLVDQLQFAKSVIVEEVADRSHEKKMAENLKLIRRKSEGCGALSKDLIRYAARVLVHSEYEKEMEQKGCERRHVIKEATANERRGSLLEEITFAKEVILPSDKIKELDNEASHRRQLIKTRRENAKRRLSLQEHLLLARDVITAPQADDGD